MTINQSFWRWISEDLNLRQHDSANLKSFTHLNYNRDVNMTFGFQVLMYKMGPDLPPYPNSPIRRDKAKEPSDTDDRRHPITSHEDPEGD